MPLALVQVLMLVPAGCYGCRTDQVACVTFAQYLVENGFPYGTEEVRRRPWTMKAGAMRELRMAQVVANGELAVGSFSDATSAYEVRFVSSSGLVPFCVWIMEGSLSRGDARLGVPGRNLTP